MPEVSEVTRDQVSTVARGLAKERQGNREGRGKAFMVRLNDRILPLIEGAKGPNQKTVEFLKEAAVTVALQRLEDSQK